MQSPEPSPPPALESSPVSPRSASLASALAAQESYLLSQFASQMSLYTSQLHSEVEEMIASAEFRDRYLKAEKEQWRKEWQQELQEKQQQEQPTQPKDTQHNIKEFEARVREEVKKKERLLELGYRMKREKEVAEIREGLAKEVEERVAGKIREVEEEKLELSRMKSQFNIKNKNLKELKKSMEANFRAKEERYIKEINELKKTIEKLDPTALEEKENKLILKEEEIMEKIRIFENMQNQNGFIQQTEANFEDLQRRNYKTEQTLTSEPIIKKSTHPSEEAIDLFVSSYLEKKKIEPLINEHEEIIGDIPEFLPSSPPMFKNIPIEVDRHYKMPEIPNNVNMPFKKFLKLDIEEDSSPQMETNSPSHQETSSHMDSTLFFKPSTDFKTSFLGFLENSRLENTVLEPDNESVANEELKSTFHSNSTTKRKTLTSHSYLECIPEGIMRSVYQCEAQNDKKAENLKLLKIEILKKVKIHEEAFKELEEGLAKILAIVQDTKGGKTLKELEAIWHDVFASGTEALGFVNTCLTINDKGQILSKIALERDYLEDKKFRHKRLYSLLRKREMTRTQISEIASNFSELSQIDLFNRQISPHLTVLRGINKSLLQIGEKQKREGNIISVKGILLEDLIRIDFWEEEYMKRIEARFSKRRR